MVEDDDDEDFFNMYDRGHWEWSEKSNELEFISDIPPAVIEVIHPKTKALTENIEFRDDVDLLEQIRFRRRYQRKLNPDEPDVVTLQDVKDIALFTAPISIMSPALINILHIPTTERFIRALIFYCQYYLQISDEMQSRLIERETKIRTPGCEIVEQKYRDNLSDLRLLVTKEYSTMLIGGGETRKFHHMGSHRKTKSLSDKDARLSETLLRICVQIVWLALGRLSFNQIELEVQRVFKSDIFNPVEHRLNTGYIEKMSKEEISVLFGNCLGKHKKLNTLSPMMDEVFCHRSIDYRLMGLGVIAFPESSHRLRYLLKVVAGPEETLESSNISLGIIGMPRSLFDTMLVPFTGKAKISKLITSANKFLSIGSTSSTKSTGSPTKVYPNIVLPSEMRKEASYPPKFPSSTVQVRPCSDVQRRRWQERLTRLRRVARAAAQKPKPKRHVKRVTIISQ